MVHILPGEITFIIKMQDWGEWLSPIMKVITDLGNPAVYLLITAIIYWSFDRQWGLKLALFLTVVISLNSILKQMCFAPRPFWVDPDIKAIKVSNGFGMPSGHAQASTFWLFTGSFLHGLYTDSGWKRWLTWIVVIALVILVGFSRVYLGAHSIIQVLAGLVIGIVLLCIFRKYESKLVDWFSDKEKRIVIKLLWLAGITALMINLGLLFTYLIPRDWVMDPEWVKNAADDLACSGKSIYDSRGLSDIAGSAGAFLGATWGALSIRKSGGFDAGGKAGKRWLRSLFGVLCLAVLFSVMRCIEPVKSGDLLHSFWAFLGFFLMLFSIIYLLPLLFKRFKLFSS